MHKSIKDIIKDSENNFIKASRLINGIICTIDSWKRKYGKNYYNGFKESRWGSHYIKWTTRLQDVNKLLKEIKNTLEIVKKLVVAQKIKTNIVLDSINRIDQIQNVINNITKIFPQIEFIISSSTADDPTKKYIKERGQLNLNKNYNDFSKNLSEEHKAVLTLLCNNIIKLVGIHSIYTTLINTLFPLILIKESKKPKEENFSISSSSSLKEQILLYKKKQEAAQNKDNFKNWVTTQYENFSNIPTATGKFLKDDEVYGVCQLPVILVNFYINKDNKKVLTHIGYDLNYILGNYIIIKNALLLGIHTNKYKKYSDIDEAWNVIKNHINEENLYISDHNKKAIIEDKLVPIGPLVKKEQHFYALLIPSLFIQYKGSGFTLNSWDIKT